jgi:hypothetical protein
MAHAGGLILSRARVTSETKQARLRCAQVGRCLVQSQGMSWYFHLGNVFF